MVSTPSRATVIFSYLQVGVWLAAFNSAANPFVYLALIPVYRQRVLELLLPCCFREEKTPPESDTELSQATSTDHTVTETDK